MKKSLIKYTFLFLTIIFFFMLFPNQAKAEETTATTNEYTLNTDGTPMDAAMDVNSKATVIFSFKVDNVSKLEVNISTKKTGWAGSDLAYVRVGVFVDKLGAKCIYTGNYTDISEDKPVTINTCLEPGTYYIIFIRNTLLSAYSKGTVTASVKTLEEFKNERPVTFDKPLTLKPESTYNSAFTSNGPHNLYFKLKLSKKGTLSLFTSAESAYPSIKQIPYKVIILDKDEVELVSNELTGAGKIEKSTFKLSKGTYYICINSSKTYYVGGMSVKARITYKK